MRRKDAHATSQLYGEFLHGHGQPHGLHLKSKWQIVSLVLIRRLGHTLSSSSGIRDATLGSDLDLQVLCSVSNYINSSGNLIGPSIIISDTIVTHSQNKNTNM